eukprot:s3053_g5.t1
MARFKIYNGAIWTAQHHPPIVQSAKWLQRFPQSLGYTSKQICSLFFFNRSVQSLLKNRVKRYNSLLVLQVLAGTI